MNGHTVKRDAVVLISACSDTIRQHPVHMVQRKYADAVFYGSHCTPLFFPAMGEELDVDVLLDHVHGVFLSGSPSNIDASLYGEDITQPHLPQDPQRDGVTLPLIRAALARGVPILGVCRGFQEINVAFGGTLHQAIHEHGEFEDHRGRENIDLDERYGPAHPLKLVEGGLLQRILCKQDTVVNSLHGQGLNSLGKGLVADAYTPDGLVEAFYIADHPSFGLAVQWHPEWNMSKHPDSLAIFDAFGVACHMFKEKINNQERMEKVPP